MKVTLTLLITKLPTNILHKLSWAMTDWLVNSILLREEQLYSTDIDQCIDTDKHSNYRYRY